MKMISLVLIIFAAVALGSVYLAKSARAQAPTAPSTETTGASQPVVFREDTAPGSSGPQGRGYSFSLNNVVISGRASTFSLASRQYGGHTFTTLMIGVNGNEGTISRGRGVSHIVLPPGVAVPAGFVVNR
jgi:ABC-type transport system substrate-binding protein